jgi:hypothetical protein
MEKALLINFLEKLQKNVIDAKNEIMPYLIKEGFVILAKHETDESLNIQSDPCFFKLEDAETDINRLLNLLKND